MHVVSSSSRQICVPTKNKRYYWDTLIFLVEDEYFNIPRYHLEKGSEFFEAIFSLPAGDQLLEGNVDANPIRLDGITTRVDFERFVDLLYPSNNTPWKSSDKTRDEWVSILKLATLWRFPSIRQAAIENLTAMSLDPLTNIALGRKYSVSQWLRGGYKELVMRVSDITLSEAEEIGYPSSIRIFRVREEMCKKHWGSRPYGSSTYSTAHWSKEVIRQAVEEEFKDELKQVDQDGVAYEA
ncbi:hypothetical protein D9758_006330 [Tetrapyrgos nigripes]|uniref:BTB domain-containing protein n=1 Tax=Tetrapyrgos nigripes TaxID=182062 RepID=A0A8H5DAU7_9AGAR|nr:hypothetical protein D9758_006330 [Tetrapyrgos nigripes]